MGILMGCYPQCERGVSGRRMTDERRKGGSLKKKRVDRTGKSLTKLDPEEKS